MQLMISSDIRYLPARQSQPIRIHRHDFGQAALRAQTAQQKQCDQDIPLAFPL